MHLFNKNIITTFRRLPREFVHRTDWQLLSADNNIVEAVMRHPGLIFRDFDKNGRYSSSGTNITNILVPELIKTEK